MGFRGHSKRAEEDQRGGGIVQNEDSGCGGCVCRRRDGWEGGFSCGT